MPYLQALRTWSLPSTGNKLATVTVDDTTLNCSLLIKNSKDKTATLTAYQQTALPRHALAPGTVFNPTIIAKTIADFLSQHNARNAPVAIALAKPHIKSLLVSQTHMQTNPYHGQDDAQEGWDWKYTYLYSDDINGFTYYACGMPHALRLQWQLLAHSQSLRLAALTSRDMALLTLYQHHRGAAFRQSQLANDLENNHHEFEQLFSQDALAHMLTVAPSARYDRDDDVVPMLTACGLLFLNEV